MEAPEKIYIQPSAIEQLPHQNIVYTKPLADNSIQYTHTDTFIERAEDFIHRKICNYIVHYNYGPNNDMETMYVDGRFFEDFKNYMKGE